MASQEITRKLARGFQRLVRSIMWTDNGRWTNGRMTDGKWSQMLILRLRLRWAKNQLILMSDQIDKVE